MSSISKSFSLLLIVLLAVSSLIIAKPVLAKTTSTVTTPSPVNTPRTIIVPDNYPTITDAIGNATSGDTILVKSGIYEGPINSTLVINKSLSIIGENTQGTIINLYPSFTVYLSPLGYFTTFSDAIDITANSCSLQDLTIRIKNTGIGGGQGGDITAVGNQTLLADDNIITGEDAGVYIEGSNCRVTNNVIDGNLAVTGDYNQIDDNSGNLLVEVSQAGGITDGALSIINMGKQIIAHASYNLVKDNTCQGLTLWYSNNNVLLGNIILGPVTETVAETVEIFASIDISWSSNNFIYQNKIYGNGLGFNFDGSSNNIVEANTVTDASGECLGLTSSDNNLFSLNNFMLSPHVIDLSIPIISTNMWSDKGLGNYWGDYQTRYPNASKVGNTGVGSIPYVINGNNADSFPLISSYDISNASVQLPTWIYLINLIVPATTDNGSTVDLAISGNITGSQMSNVTITTNQFAKTTTVSFIVIGESSTMGFGNITIPKSAVTYGTTPKIYIDGQPAQNQGYTQDSSNYYVWYTTSFSTQISIAFTTKSLPKQIQLSLAQDVIFAVAIAVVVILLLIYVRYRIRKK